MKLAAAVGIPLWLSGAVLLFLVPGGAWSDVPGGLLLLVGVLIEVVATVASLAGRSEPG